MPLSALALSVLPLLCASQCATWAALFAGEESWPSPARGLSAASRACDATLFALSALAYAPPSDWQVFNALCRGACRDLSSRLARLDALDAATNCSCAPAATRACPRPPAAMLCARAAAAGGGACLSAGAAAAWCAPAACGRRATDEAAWRAQTAACAAA
jgi:hypothetical protein